MAGFNNQIIRKLHFLTATVNQIAESVHLLINRGLTQNAVVNFEKLFILPIETADGIQSLEKELKSAEKTRKENSRIIKVNEKKDALVSGFAVYLLIFIAGYANLIISRLF